MILIAALCLLSGGFARAQAERPPSDSTPPPIVISGPRVAKLDWNTRALTAADFNGDGLTDLALINNDRAKIDLLIQTPTPKSERESRSGGEATWQPEFSDVPFDKVSVVISVTAFDLAAGDLNGDGHPDLAYSGRPDALTVQYQRDGAWDQTRVFDVEAPAIWVETVAIMDIDRDEREDLLVLTKGSLLVFQQDGHGKLQGPQTYPISDPSLGICSVDADADGFPDLIYQAPGKENPLRLRLNQGADLFGPEQVFDVPAPSTLFRPIPQPSSQAREFVTIQAKTNLISRMRFSEAEGRVPFQEISPRVFGVPASNGASSYAFGDFDDNGRLDLAWAGNGTAQVLVFFQNERGILTLPEIFPTFAEPKSLAAGDLDGDGHSELIVASGEEKSLGISRFTKKRRLSYPKPLVGVGQPHAVACADLDGDGLPEIVSLQTDGSKRSVAVFRRKSVDADWTVTTYPIEGLKTDPRALELLDANQDGRLDLVVFTVQEPVRFFIADKHGDFTALSAMGDYQQGLVHNITPSALTTGDVDGDGIPEMLIAEQGFARALKVNGDNRLEVIDQFNAQSTDDRIDAAFALDIDFDGTQELLLFHGSDEAFQVLKRQESGVYRYTTSRRVGPIGLVASSVVDLDQNGYPDVFLLGQERFMRLPLGSQDLALESAGLFETRQEDVWFNELAVGDLNADNRAEFIAVDATETHIMELWRGEPQGQWSPFLHFRIFEKDPHYRGRQGSEMEPREMITADVTGDGKHDLVLLVHDRLLVYPQQ